MRELLSIGIFITAQIAAEFLAFSVSIIFVGWLGEVALASQQIIIQINALLVAIPYALSQSSGIFISQALGAKKIEEIRYMGVAALILWTVLWILLLLLFCFFHDAVIGFYLDSNAPGYHTIAHTSLILLFIAFFALLFNGLRAVASGSLRGLYDAKPSMQVSIFISGLLSLIAGYILANWLNWGVFGIGIGFVGGFLLAAAILIWRWFYLSIPKVLCKKCGVVVAK